MDGARCVDGCGPSPALVLQLELLSEIVAVQVRLPGAQVGVGIAQGADLGYGELRGPQRGVQVGALHYLQRQLQATGLREQLSGEKGNTD